MNVEPTGSQAVVTGAIRQAAQLTGADFKYLLATAQVESRLNSSAQGATSSARGLFQFIDQTWLATLKEQGPALGYAPYANAISRTPSGDYAVADPGMTKAIMNLRADPNASAVMAGAFTKANAGKLAARLGRQPTEGELYIAHFLGPSGASRLIAIADSRPYTPAAAVFPGAARANSSIFYGRGGARSAAEVYRLLVDRYQTARGAPAETDAVAATKPEEITARAVFSPDSAPIAGTYAAAMGASRARRADEGPMFHSLFRSSESQPVAPVVRALWGAPPPAVPSPAATPAEPTRPTVIPEKPAEAAEGPSGPLDLFQDKLPDARALFRGSV